MILVAAIFLAVFVLDSPWDAIAVAAGGLVEVAEAVFWLRLSRRRPAAIGAEALIGQLGEVAVPCRPIGQVRLKGELWRARCAEGADVGETVRVLTLEDLTLVVERERAASLTP